MKARQGVLLPSIFCLLSLVSGTCWLWSTCWLTASVEAMAEDMERTGIVDAARAAELRAAGNPAHSSTGLYLMQGHDGRSLAAGCVLWGIAITGFATLAFTSFRTVRSMPAG